MRKVYELNGQRFGKLTAEKRIPAPNGGWAQWWRFRCECGGVMDCPATRVASEKGRRCCGCNWHGGTGTRLHQIWGAMRQRCRDPNSQFYKDYGGRGIFVSSEWANDFKAFRAWAHANGYREDLTLERIDNDGCYSPSNCRWATAQEQAVNRRSSRNYEWQGQTYNLAEIARIAGAKYATLRCRIDAGLSVDEALRIKRYGKLKKAGTAS